MEWAMQNEELARIRMGLEEAIQAILMLRSEMAQRETRMGAAFDQQVQSLRAEVGQFRHDIRSLVGGASAQIARESRAALTPVAAEYDRAVTATSAQLVGASRTVWMWFGAAATTLLLTLLVAWAVLGYYRRELASAQDALQRYEDAIPVVQAFHASDAVICGGRICTNADPAGQQAGDRQQYRQARPRP
ncbi:hypothetical protein [Luteimonas aestuarii]|nr:hypothetical protein [Luteimonas aestuarii]